MGLLKHWVVVCIACIILASKLLSSYVLYSSDRVFTCTVYALTANPVKLFPGVYVSRD